MRYGRHLVFAGVVRPDRTVLVIVAAVVWLGCSRLASKEEERTGREFLAHVARGEPIPPARTDASLRTPEASARLAVLQDQLHGVDAASAERVGVGSMHGPDDRTLVFFDFTVRGRDGPALVRVTLLRGATPILVGLHVRGLTTGGRAPPMTRRGVGAVLVLTSLILAPMVTLIALVRLWRAPRSRKWPWALFILLGIGKLMVNWNTGQIAVQLLAIQLFSGSVFQMLTGDWILAVSLPLGAMIYLLRPKLLPAPPPLNLPPDS